MALRVHEGVLRDTLAALRLCGSGRREGVVYWAGTREDAGLVDQVLYPRHHATIGSYELDADWVTECWIELARNHRMLKAQLHSHPGEAFHSATDDRYPIVQTPGFTSIVLPRFAQAGFNGARAYELQANGGWLERPILQAFRAAA